MPRSSDVAARRARAAAASAVTRAATLLRDDEPLTCESRAQLVALLEHAASDRARDSIDVHTWEALMRFSRAVVEPHREPEAPARPLPPGFESRRPHPGHA